ncbi:hypothetical protein SD70_24155 [Gordoniibacillus kamchatkensis]|uniref:Heparinase II/III-like protein n=1 Tax=Gordoniibacillus kamchatkensis TaxID=1590651 RepID=A0ABR5AD65_9BACL|nr:heparinase II/III family protein [Paenibacillus sp. VKM B-2647]KIL38783.1 hypothetical protein SD70_24155 [Paenibacillus sp. VKM B-2647]
MDRGQLSACLTETPHNARLLFPDGTDPQQYWRRLRDAEEYRAAVEEIRAEGERLLREPIPELTYSLFAMFERSGNRLEFEKVYFEKRRRLTTMALLALIEPENRNYREALEDILWSICNEYTWCLPAHLKGSLETDGGQTFDVDSSEWSRRERGTRIDLFAAETGFALCEIVRLTEPRLPALLRSRIVEEVVQRIFKPYLLHGPYHWETSENNWAAVCAGSIASAALHLIEAPEQLAPIVEKALASMDCYLAGFGDDGACLESVGYWNYGFGFFIYFADLLHKRTRGAIDLFQSEKVRRIAQFQQKAYLEGDITVNFSDCLQRANVNIGLTHYLACLYPGEVASPPLQLRAPYTEDHCSRWAPALRNLLWFDPAKSGTRWEAADYFLPDAQWLVSRYESADGTYGFAAKGGHNGEPHNHNDLGHFILTCCGEVFLCDLGSGEYTDRYFGPERFSFDCNGSQGHSVPIAEGRFQTEGTASAAQCLDIFVGEDRIVFELELAKAYGLTQLRSLVRKFAWHKAEKPLLVLEDRFAFKAQPAGIVERFVTMIEPVAEGGGVVAMRSETGRKLAIRYDERQLEPIVRRSTYRNHFGKETVWYALDFAVLRPQPEIAVTFTFQFCS